MKNLTASNRRSLIRLASTLPVGSDERKAILAGLSEHGHTRGRRRASGPVRNEDLDILAGDIIGYSYDRDGPESGIPGLRYLAQDTGAIWKAAEEAGFESDDPVLEHFLELSDNDRFRILKRNQRTR